MERKVKYDYAFKLECVELVFKKHYSDNKSRLGGEPGTIKGSYDNRNPFIS